MSGNQSKPENQEFIEVTITRNTEISPGVHLVAFRKHGSFQPGQVIKIAIDRIHPPRIYSICSGNHEDEIRVLFNIKQDGFLSPRLASLIPGDKIHVSLPYGSFTENNKSAFWIATGTGIAPFYSMFRSGLSKNKTLIHGVRFLNQFYFGDEFEREMGDRYIRCCSAEKSDKTYFGRVTQLMAGLDLHDPDLSFYLCGKALMVVEVRDLLISKGIPYDKINAEIYF